LTLVQNDTYYSREGTTVSAPIRGRIRQMLGDMFKKEKKASIQENTKTKTKFLPSRHALTSA